MDAMVVDNLSKRFRIPHEKKTTLLQNIVGVVRRQFDYEEFWALKDISFTVEKGEAFGIIGRNGSGKSTLLRILAKCVYPESGSVTTSGKVASFLELGVGFQPELTAAENVYIYASILGLSRNEVKSRYDEIFDFAELRRFESMKLKNFSAGMYMRMAFATAIHTDPDIMLIDEIFAVGDESFQKKCIDKIHAFQKQGKTIIFVTHSLDALRSICRRSLLVEKGSIISIGITEEVINDYHSMMYGEAPSIPPAPNLSFPDDRATVNGPSVNFQWNPSDGATKYLLRVSTIADAYIPKAYFWQADVGNVLSYTVTGFPDDGSTYYWWVYAGIDAGWTLHSKAVLKGHRFTNGKAPTIPKPRS